MNPIARLIAFLGVVTCVAYAEPTVALPLDTQSKILAEVTRFQDIADGNWNHSFSAHLLKKGSFGKRTISSAEVAFLMKRADLYLERAQGLALFLRLYDYSDVRPIWDRLRSVAEEGGKLDEPFRMIVSDPLAGPAEYRKTTINRIHTNTKQANKTRLDNPH
jgi:hypothetical protein